MTRKFQLPRVLTGAFTAVAVLLAGSYSSAALTYTPYWFDGYDVSANVTDINFETATRQGGAPAPVSYVANTADPTNDYHHQLFAGGGTPLLLAGDFNLINTRVSPTVDFSGAAGNEIIGKKIQLTVDVGVTVNPPSPQSNIPVGTFTQASVTVGASSTLQAANTATNDGFTVSFVEDNFSNLDGTGLGNFIQIYHGTTLLDNLIPNPAGAGPGFVEIFVDDSADGNPWDGIGSTTFDVYVNGTQLVGGISGPWTIGGGGLTSNVITLEGNQQSNNSQLATHTFDSLTVFTAPVPEPTSIALTAVAMALGMIVVRGRQK